MSKRDHIRAVEGEEPAEGAAPVGETVLAATEPEMSVEDEWYEEPVKVRSWRWVVPTLSLFAIAGWSGFFAWVNHAAMLDNPTPAQVADWIVAWSTPTLLVLAVWILSLRNSTRESKRFGEIAQTLSQESAQLETRLTTVNRELSLAREFLTAQSRDLEYLGRSASERISEHAGRLQDLVQTNGAQVDAIAGVSTTALENMTRLRDNLPVIANSARDVSNQIGSAGRSAQEQVGELVAGFQRLNEFGAASERQVQSLRKRVDEILAMFTAQTDQLQALTNQRFAALREESDAFRGELDSREVEVLAAMQARSQALQDELGALRSSDEAQQDAAFAALATRSEAVRASLAAVHSALAQQQEDTRAAMQSRIDTLRDDAAAIASAVREGEDAALGAWGSQIEALQQRLRTAIADVAAIDDKALASANAKLQALSSEAQAIDDRLEERDRRFNEEIARRRAEFDRAEATAAEALAARLAAFDEAVGLRRTEQREQMALLDGESEALGHKIASLGDTFATVSAQGREAHSTLAEGIDALASRLVESREALDGTDMAVAALTDASVRLLELIQASAKHSRDDLPAAMQASEARLAAIEHRAGEVRALLDQARLAGDALTESMAAAEGSGRSTMEEAEAFQSRFGETAAAQAAAIERLRAGVAALGSETDAVADKAQHELRAAIAALEESGRQALAAIETDQAERIAAIARSVGEQSTAAIDRALQTHTEAALGQIDSATERATEAGRDLMLQLRDQLAKVGELTANLEARISQARDRAEDQVGNDFARRVALISESLNSNAIDIAKALSTDVTDTAWASYLRGDRGIFTRRAVRLVDNTEARAIAELYDTDRDFREHVSRYIHDFEAMLRTILSTRDGNAVSVTLLSSDMGKLYVALAQALERLRQ